MLEFKKAEITKAGLKRILVEDVETNKAFGIFTDNDALFEFYLNNFERNEEIPEENYYFKKDYTDKNSYKIYLLK